MADSSATTDTRESRVETLLTLLRSGSESTLRRMAQRLADLPEGEAFGQIEFDLRDLAHDLASYAHQAGLQAAQKKATSAPAPAAPTVMVPPASSATARSPG